MQDVYINTRTGKILKIFSIERVMRRHAHPAPSFDGGIAMREKVIEQKLVAEVKRRGGICPKWVSQGFDGMPDRIVLLPGRHFGLVEVKAPGERPRPLQVSRHRLLMRLGFRVYVLDDPEQIGGILDEIQST